MSPLNLRPSTFSLNPLAFSSSRPDRLNKAACPLYSNMLPKLNLGCGTSVFEGWVNIDSSITARLSKFPRLYKFICRFSAVKPIEWPANITIVDVRKKLPFHNNSVGAVFSSHMLEHLSLKDAGALLKDVHRCLVKGGIVRLIVPDLYAISKRYVNSVESTPESGNAAEFLNLLNLIGNPYKGIKAFLYEKLALSRHLYMYDEESLTKLLEDNGFREIKRTGFGESLIENISAFEDKGRHLESICLEAVKQ